MLDKKLITDANEISVRPIGVRSGVILGLVSLIVGIGSHISGLMDIGNPNGSGIISNLVTWLPYFVIMYLAIKELRDVNLGGFISLGKCIKLGLVVCAVASVLSTLGFQLYIFLASPNFYTDVLDAMRENLEVQGKSDEEIDMIVGMTGKFMSPIPFAITGILAGMFTGIVVSFIIGLFMRKESATPFA